MAQIIPFRTTLTEPIEPDPIENPPAEPVLTGTIINPPAGPISRDDLLKPIVPSWVKTPEGRAATIAWWRRKSWHQIRWHLWHLPALVLRILLRAPIGLIRAVVSVWEWAFDVKAGPLEQALASNGQATAKEWLRVRDDRATRVRGRLICLGLAAIPTVALIVALCLSGPLIRLPAAGVVAVLLAWIGTNRDQALVGHAVTPFEAPKLTAPMVERALGSLGNALINAALKDEAVGIGFPAPIQREELGWRADIDLPLGVTPASIMEKRSELASGLRRPLGCVWPEGAPDIHEGRMVLHVLDRDFSSLAPPPWPLAKPGATHDFFSTYTFGWDTRGRAIPLCLNELNMLVGALPGQGKTATMRVAASAAALDPTVQLWITELAGKGDFEDLAPVLHRYINGIDDDSIRQTAAMLSELRRECERRLHVLGTVVPSDMKPDKKVTREIADHKAFGLFPLVAIFDEVQNVFMHPEVGKQAGLDAEVIIRLARAVAVVLILGTQIPDAKSFPTGVSRMAGLRFALKVMGQTENDMILGTSMYKNGYRASELRLKVDAGIGILVGATDAPTITRSAYLDGPAVARIAERALVLRQRAGTVTGHAAGHQPEPAAATVNVIEDVHAVFESGETALWNEALLSRLQVLRPGHYDGWKSTQLTGALKAAGLARAGRQVERLDPTTGVRRNRNGVHLVDLLEVVPEAVITPNGD